MNILVIGPQGSGKSTQAKLLAKKLKVSYLSTGEIFRQMAKTETAFGKRIKRLINQGNLVDDKTTLKIIKEYLKKPEFEKGFVAEGFPRNLFQVEKLQKVFDKVFHLAISKKEIMKRLASRRVCQNCKANFNLLTKPPKKKGVCDSCGGKLVQREDDKKKAIEKRLIIYQKLTQPVLSFYQRQGILEEIDGERPAEEIFQDIFSQL